MGRLFGPGENVADAVQQVVLTSKGWSKFFSSDQAAIGQTVTLNGNSTTVLGILPPTFPGVRAGDELDFYVLLVPESPFLERAVKSSEHWWVRLMARLRPGAADAQLRDSLTSGFSPLVGDQLKEPRMVLQPGHNGLAADRNHYRKPLLMMMGVVGVVMLVACANLAGLSLARGAVRQHELAIRAALGAGRWRLIRQSLVESILLGLLGSVLGGFLAVWGRNVIARLLSGQQGTLRYDVSLDFTVLTAGILAAVITAILSGLISAARAGRSDPVNGLKSRGVLGAPRLRTGKILVAAQICLSLILLTGAGLYFRTVLNLKNIDAGFKTENLLVIQVNPTPGRFNQVQLSAFYDQLENAVGSIPGIQNCSVIRTPLLDGQVWTGDFVLPGRPPQSADLQTHRMVVGDSYFSTLGIPLLQGRAIQSSDVEAAGGALVVNNTFVKNYLAQENPLGRMVNMLGMNWRIVGVCGDTKFSTLKEPAPPTVYFSYRLFPLKTRASLVVRTLLPPNEVTPAIRHAMAGINPSVPITRITTQEQLRDGSISQERLFATLCGALAAFALLLSCIGLYGLMSYNVARRMGEIGIRMALGARAGDVARSILREALCLATIGIGIGFPAVLGLALVIKSQLYGVEPRDPATLIGVTIVLLMVAMLSAWFPALRAARVHPMEALRTE